MSIRRALAWRLYRAALWLEPRLEHAPFFRAVARDIGEMPLNVYFPPHTREPPPMPPVKPPKPEPPTGRDFTGYN